MAESQHAEAGKQPAPERVEQTRDLAGEEPAALVQRAMAPGFQGGRIDARRLTPQAILALQRTVGNSVVNQLLHPVTKEVEDSPMGQSNQLPTNESWTSSDTVRQFTHSTFEEPQRGQAVRSNPQNVQRGLTWRAAPPRPNPPNQFDALLAALDALVTNSANAILANPLHVAAAPNAQGYVQRWYDVVQIYFNNRTQLPPFLYSAFGYAVESCVNNLILGGALLGHLPANHTVVLQGGRGMTRPDIVVRNGVGQDVAWFDITANNGKFHIGDKSGAWKNPLFYVAEVTYPKLVPANLQLGQQGPAQQVLIDHALKREKRLQKSKATALRVGAIAPIVRFAQNEGNQGRNRDMIRDQMKIFFGIDTISHSTTRSLLVFVKDQLNEDYLSIFGYKGNQAKGRDRESSRELLEEIDV